MKKYTGNSQALAELVQAALDDKKGVDVLAIDVRKKTTVTDYMIMASGASTRQVKSLADHVLAQAKQVGAKPLGIEGTASAEWVLVDLGDVVVHIMLPEVREFYQLERLWSLATPATANGDDA